MRRPRAREGGHRRPPNAGLPGRAASQRLAAPRRDGRGLPVLLSGSSVALGPPTSTCHQMGTPKTTPQPYKHRGTRLDRARGSCSHTRRCHQGQKLEVSLDQPISTPPKGSSPGTAAPGRPSTRGGVRHRRGQPLRAAPALRSSRGKVKLPFHSALVNGYFASNSTNFMRVQSANSFKKKTKPKPQQ